MQKMKHVYDKDGGSVSVNCTYDEDILAFRKQVHALLESIFSADDENNPSSVC